MVPPQLKFNPSRQSVKHSFFLSLACLVFGIGPATAATYQLSYTGHRMVASADSGDKPIRGVKHLSIVVQSPTPFPKSACIDVAPEDVTVFTDGVDTPASLSAAGYVFQTGSPFSICTDSTGKKLVSWNIRYEYIKPKHGLKDYYGAISIFPAQSPNPEEDLVYFLFPRAGGAKMLENLNSDDPGKWKYQVLD